MELNRPLASLDCYDKRSFGPRPATLAGCGGVVAVCGPGGVVGRAGGVAQCGVVLEVAAAAEVARAVGEWWPDRCVDGVCVCVTVES